MKEVGVQQKFAFLYDIDGSLLRITEIQGWSQERRVLYATQIRKALQTRGVYPMVSHRIVCGRKP